MFGELKPKSLLSILVFKPVFVATVKRDLTYKPHVFTQFTVQIHFAKRFT